MGERVQFFEANVDMAKAFRQFQKADKAFWKDKDGSAEKHLERGLELLKKVADHLVQGTEDVYNNASKEVGKGNDELQKSIDSFDDDNDDRAEKHYQKALDHYDKALDMIS
ncbi:hypothetical protein [Robertkochia aurantiaca]|uniref:hypothetical protein n=1 Tax=Robertkochia aurantiaca TaxID=2873700 RepID=UPI001CCAE8F4|nr:hypothetical protein [Robertkochia sp. 3YJGBD-33]